MSEQVADCPAPGCGRTPGVLRTYEMMIDVYRVQCAPICGYRGPNRQSRTGAIEAHNAITGRTAEAADGGLRAEEQSA